MRELNLDGIKSYVANLRIGQEGYLFVLDRNGELLTSTDSVTRTVERELATNEALRELAADTKNGQAAMRDTFMSFTLGGQESFAASSIVPMTGWVAVAAVPVREINQSTQLQTSIFLWTALATGVTSLGIALWFVRAITAPLGTLIENINRVADGQLEYTAHEHRKDEFAQVYDAVNLMAHRLNASYNQLSTAAHTDMLTGLANRKAVYEMMERRFSAHCAAFMVDLDGFKEVNDRYGHDIGDAVLIAVADVLRELEQDDVCVARLGGDEFFVFFAQYDEAAAIVSTARRLCEDLRALREVQGRAVNTAASIGVAFSSAQDEGYPRLLKKSDLAMYEIKKSGKGGVYVYPDVP